MINLNNVPTKIRNGKKIYDWSNSIGTIIEIVDDDTKESVKVPIVKYEKTGARPIYVKYMGNEIPISTNHIEILKGDKIFGKYNGDFRFKIGDVINNIEIIDRKNIDNCKKYQYRCLECGEIGWIDETYLKLKANDFKHRCTIPITAPWMIPYFSGGYEEAKKYTHSSAKRIYPICPNCKNQSKKSVMIKSLYQMKSFQCICNDNISYGEKFFISFLEQLNIDFIHQYSLKGLRKIYDFYIPSLNAIVEIHGEQHYIDVPFFEVTHQKEQENDELKMQYALSHGISKYIVIDARKSNKEWLKEHILSSELSELFDCASIDWDACHRFTLKNRIFEVCEYIMKHSTQALREHDLECYMKKFHIKRFTLNHYIKMGNENFEWCDIKIKKKHDKTIEIIKDEKVIGTGHTYVEVAKYIKERDNIILLETEIRHVCIGDYKQYKGYKFRIVA